MSGVRPYDAKAGDHLGRTAQAEECKIDEGQCSCGPTLQEMIYCKLHSNISESQHAQGLHGTSQA